MRNWHLVRPFLSLGTPRTHVERTLLRPSRKATQERDRSNVIFHQAGVGVRRSEFAQALTCLESRSVYVVLELRTGNSVFLLVGIQCHGRTRLAARPCKAYGESIPQNSTWPVLTFFIQGGRVQLRKERVRLREMQGNCNM